MLNKKHLCKCGTPMKADAVQCAGCYRKRGISPARVTCACGKRKARGAILCGACQQAKRAALPRPASEVCTCGARKDRDADRCRGCFEADRDAALGGTHGRPSETIVDKGIEREVTKTTSERVKTLADLIRVCEIDTETWDVERWLCNKWDMASVPRLRAGTVSVTGDPVVTEIYQIKAWLRRRVEIIDARNEIAALIVDAKLHIEPRSGPALVSGAKGDLLLELAIPDLHAGKLAWKDETGQGHYDTKIAQSRFEGALETLLSRVSGLSFAKVLFVIGNDLLNADNIEGNTAAGTPQDNDARFHKTFGVVRQMLTRAIDRVREVAPEVMCTIVPGNHDKLAAWHMGDSLECYFHKTPGVTVDNAPTYRKYQHFGKVMLMFTHGDRGKHQNYPLLMATEQPKIWAATVHREVHLGHWHKKRIDLDEYHGVKVRVCSALCEVDVWHADQGFIGNERAAEAFVWHKEDGLILTANHVVKS